MSQRQEICVIFNPAAGRQRAAARLEMLRQAWKDRAEFRATQGPGHAEELAKQAACAGFAVVAAAGGDGTVHEVANGLLEAERPQVAFAVIPLGSANDYADSLTRDSCFSQPAVNGLRHVDVGVIRAPSGRQRFFVCCLGLGLNGAVTLESRRIHGLQGVALYGLATWRALCRHYRCPEMEIQLDDQPVWTTPTLMLSLLIARREGGFVLGPNACLDDGLFEMVHAGRLSRFGVLRLLPRLALAGPPSNHAAVRLGRCRRVQLRSAEPLIVHLDGEFFCTPSDGVREIEVAVLPGRLPVRSLST